MLAIAIITAVCLLCVPRWLSLFNSHWSTVWSVECAF